MTYIILVLGSNSSKINHFSSFEVSQKYSLVSQNVIQMSFKNITKTCNNNNYVNSKFFSVFSDRFLKFLKIFVKLFQIFSEFVSHFFDFLYKFLIIAITLVFTYKFSKNLLTLFEVAV